MRQKVLRQRGFRCCSICSLRHGGGSTLTGRNERKCRRFLTEGSKTRGGGECLGVEVWIEKKGRESERKRPSLCDVDLFSLELAVSHADEPCSF